MLVILSLARIRQSGAKDNLTGERNPAYACDAMRPRVVKRRLLRACDKTRYRGSSWQVLLVGSMAGGHAGSIRCIPLPSGFRGRTRERSPGWLLLLARAAALQMAHAPEGFVRREMDAMIHWRHCGKLPRTVVMPVRRTDTYTLLCLCLSSASAGWTWVRELEGRAPGHLAAALKRRFWPNTHTY